MCTRCLKSGENIIDLILTASVLNVGNFVAISVHFKIVLLVKCYKTSNEQVCIQLGCVPPYPLAVSVS